MEPVAMACIAAVSTAICLLLDLDRRNKKKKIESLTNAIAEFVSDPKLQLKETLQEGCVANLQNEIVRLETLYFHRVVRAGEESREQIQFMENMAHQLKTTLTALQLRMDSAQLAAGTEAEQYALFRSQECLNRMTGEVNRILNSSRLAAGAVAMQWETVLLDDMVQQCATNLKPLMEQKDIVFTDNVPEKLRLSADVFWMEQAMENLIKNALEHTDGGGRVTVSAGAAGSRIWVRVEDDGEGIEEEELPHLFERFHRGKNAKAGYGIGLSMASDIVKAHHGTLRAGNGEQGGAWFVMELPVLEGAAAYD